MKWTENGPIFTDSLCKRIDGRTNGSEARVALLKRNTQIPPTVVFAITDGIGTFESIGNAKLEVNPTPVKDAKYL